MESCIYEGQVSHSRRKPVLHRFRYRVFMMYLDLAELDTVFEKRWFWSTRRAAIARFDRRNHSGSEGQALDESVRELVQQETGSRPSGPIRLLTNLSYFGYCFNPVSYYYCFEDDGLQLNCVVAEVTNTPWGERDTYVLPVARSKQRGSAYSFREAKKMHVSPFMPMEMEYEFKFVPPGDRLNVLMANILDNNRVFDASMNFRRSDINGRALARVLSKFPFMTLKVVFAIHWEALKLWIKRCPVYIHPANHRASRNSPVES